MPLLRSCFSLFVLACLLLPGCQKEAADCPEAEEVIWVRSENNPVLRDLIPNENYQVASDPHVFYDAAGNLSMIYTGDANGVASIKLARATTPDQWTPERTLLSQVGPSGNDIYKETAFYFHAPNGKHQIYYIGYPEEATYEASIYLAEADALEGPYTQLDNPVVARGALANRQVYLITSPSVVAHDGRLYLCFLGWNAAPNAVTAVWTIGAVSDDNGHTWKDFQLVETPIGMEGQVTQLAEDDYVAVRTGDFGTGEAIFYARAAHPFGPWKENPAPILVPEDPVLEKDEMIAPQITVDPNSSREFLFYTGADLQIGWWVMLAEKR